jgi:hypothetical protein
VSDAGAPAPISSPELIAIPVLRIPVPIWASSQEHIDELFREFTLIAADQHEHVGNQDVPKRLMQLIDDVTSRYGGLNTDQENRLAEAAHTGMSEIDLTYHVPVEARQACIDLQVMLDEADIYCRSGEHLLTLATPPELVRFEHWFLEEFVRQLDGEPPMPWPDYPR